MTKDDSETRPGAGSPAPAERLRRLLRAEGEFELGPRCAERLRERALLIDSERLELRALACLAYGNAAESQARDRDRVREGIDRAIAELLLEDARDDALGLVPQESPDSPFAFLSTGFGVEEALALSAAVRFNGLPDRERRAFFELVLEERSVEECLARGLGPLGRMKDEVLSAFSALYNLPLPRRCRAEGDGPA